MSILYPKIDCIEGELFFNVIIAFKSRLTLVFFLCGSLEFLSLEQCYYILARRVTGAAVIAPPVARCADVISAAVPRMKHTHWLKYTGTVVTRRIKM